MADAPIGGDRGRGLRRDCDAGPSRGRVGEGSQPRSHSRPLGEEARSQPEGEAVPPRSGRGRVQEPGRVQGGTDPRDADSDNDGIPDGQENAGTIASFDGTTLTISLYAGGEVSGEVTDQTRIICPSSDDGSADTATSSADSASEGGGCQQGEPCTADSLAVGAKVVEAELRATSEGSVFTKVKLG
jgi:hypothetical protein